MLEGISTLPISRCLRRNNLDMNEMIVAEAATWVSEIAEKDWKNVPEDIVPALTERLMSRLGLVRAVRQENGNFNYLDSDLVKEAVEQLTDSVCEGVHFELTWYECPCCQTLL